MASKEDPHPSEEATTETSSPSPITISRVDLVELIGTVVRQEFANQAAGPGSSSSSSGGGELLLELLVYPRWVEPRRPAMMLYWAQVILWVMRVRGATV